MLLHFAVVARSQGEETLFLTFGWMAYYTVLSKGAVHTCKGAGGGREARKEGKKEIEFESDTVLLPVIITIYRMMSYRRSIASMVALDRSACLETPKAAPTQQLPWSSIHRFVLGGDNRRGQK